MAPSYAAPAAYAALSGGLEHPASPAPVNATAAAAATAASASSPAPAANATAAPSSNADRFQEVCWSFVEQYYTHVNKDQDKLHLFYKKDSTAIHGTETQSVQPYHGQREIVQLIAKHNFRNCKVMVSNIDCQRTLADGVLVQVIGEMANEGEPSQKFVQTILLAPQNNGYYVLNDIMRFLKEDAPSEFGDYEKEPVFDDAKSTAEAKEEAPKVEAKDTPKEPEAVTPAATASTTAQAPAAAAASTNAESSLFSQSLENKKEEAKVEEPVAAPAAQETQSETKSEEPVEKASEKPAEKSVANGSAEKQAAAPAAAPAAPVTPALPATPMSWAARAAQKPPTAAATSPAASTATAASPAAATPAATASPSVSAAAAAAALNEKPSPPSPAAVAATATGHRRGPKEYFSAYIKHVSDNVNEKQLKSALQAIGTVTHFEVARHKNCAFVDFIDLPTLKAALAVHDLKLPNGATVLVEERKRGGAKKNNNYNNANANNNANGNNANGNGYYNQNRRANGQKKGGAAKPQQ